MKRFALRVGLVVGVPMVSALGVGEAVAAPPVSSVRVVDDSTPITICGDGVTGGPGTVLFQVPADRRLEIEYGSIRNVASLPGEVSGVMITILTTVGGVEGEFLVGKIRGGTEVPPTFDADARVMKVFADPGTAVRVSQGIFRIGQVSDPFPSARVCLSGRLVP